MRILVACDSFKDAVTAEEACAAIARGLRRARAGVSVIQLPVSDGGEGAVSALSGPLSLRMITAAASDPIGRTVEASYGLSADAGVAVVEMATAAGLERLTAAERNPERTTTFGVGELLADARRRGARRAILAIGGSATNDGGVGAAAALGWRFLDGEGREIANLTGGGLSLISGLIAPPELPFERLEVLCDVQNPLCGPSGAAAVYGPQKGADSAAVARLDAGLAHLAALAANQLGLDLAERPGAGAAGGLGFGAMAFLGGELRRGADVVLDLVGFDAEAKAADLIVTGEGRLDSQTAQGKLISTLARRAGSTPVVALCGALDATPEAIRGLGLSGAYAINDGSGPLSGRLARTAADLEEAAAILPELSSSGA
jgi:glycerate 2-kinase